MTAEMRASDEELYRRMRSGDRGALAELYERLGGRIYRYVLYASGRRPMAEEVTQEVFLRLIGSGVKFDERRGSVEAYLHGLARNVMRRMPPPPGDEGAELLAEHDLLGELLDDERTAALYEALANLPERYREAVMLCDLEERSYEEAARLMQCPVGTVRSRLHRARLLLSDRLSALRPPAMQVAAR